MKRKFIFLSLISFSLLSLASCSEEPEVITHEEQKEVMRTNFFLNSSSEQLYVGSEFTLFPKTYESSEGLTWLSSNPSIATVSSEGMVNALKPGETTISAFDSESIGTCKISVITYDDTYFVELSTTSITLNVGDSYGVVPTLKTNDRIIEAEFSVSLFEESTEGICEVEFIDNRYVFTALKSGNCTYSFITSINDVQYGENLHILIH